MKLEVGKTYIRRDGGVETVDDINIKDYYEVRALSDKHYTKDYYVVKTTSDKYYTNEGRYRNPTQDSPWDLVRELTPQWLGRARRYSNKKKQKLLLSYETHDGREYVHTGMGLFPSEKNDTEQELAVIRGRIACAASALETLYKNNIYEHDPEKRSVTYATCAAYLDALRIVTINLIDIKI